MKKLIVLICTFFATSLFAQSFIECPNIMEKDTLYSANTDIRYLFFNSGDDSTKKIYNQGSIDLDIYPTMESTASGDDTLSVSIKGFKLKKREGNVNARGVGQVETLFGDSTYVGTVVVDTLLHTFSIENLFDSTFFPMFDGIAVTYWKNGSDADSVNVWTNLKVFK
jgi:hypothetical protein